MATEKNQSNESNAATIIFEITNKVLEMEKFAMTGEQWKLQHKLIYYLNKYNLSKKI